MTIFKKIADVQMELQKIEFTKSGHNKFGNFKYFELDDIMPCIQTKCYEQGLMMQFLFTEKKATLMIVDVQSNERFCNEIPMPEIKELNKKMNVVQSLGAYITYLKRYLLLNTFCICEKSVIDSDEMSKMANTKKIQQKRNVPERTVERKDASKVAKNYATNIASKESAIESGKPKNMKDYKKSGIEFIDNPKRDVAIADGNGFMTAKDFKQQNSRFASPTIEDFMVI